MHDLLTQRSSSTSQPTPLASRQFFLIVEDPSTADMITWALTLAGYRLIKGETPTLSHISPDDSPTVILFDVGFLPASASQVLAEVQAQCTVLDITAPIIVLTTSPDIQREVESIGYRALLKPFHVQDLTEAVREVLSLSPPPHMSH